MIKLLQINSYQDMILKPISLTHWVLCGDYTCSFVTNEGTITTSLLSGWVTDKRSGCSLIDKIIPKWSDNKLYQAVISTHDCSYSGWLTKELADELFVHQGFEMSGEIGSFRSSLAYTAVKCFGNSGYYGMNDELPSPYQNNRNYESVRWSDK